MLVLECRQLYLLGGFVSCIAYYMSTKAVFETEVFIVHNGPAAVTHAPAAVNKSWSQDSQQQYARLPCLLLFIEVIAMVSLTFSEVDALFSFQEISCGLPSLRASGSSVAFSSVRTDRPDMCSIRTGQDRR